MTKADLVDSIAQESGIDVEHTFALCSRIAEKAAETGRVPRKATLEARTASFAQRHPLPFHPSASSPVGTAQFATRKKVAPYERRNEGENISMGERTRVRISIADQAIPVARTPNRRQASTDSVIIPAERTAGTGAPARRNWASCSWRATNRTAGPWSGWSSTSTEATGSGPAQASSAPRVICVCYVATR